MSVDIKNKKMTIEIRKRQMGFQSLTVHKDSNSGFKKEANTEVPKYLHSILWPAGTTKKWLQKDKKNDWLAIQRSTKITRWTISFCLNPKINDHIDPKSVFYSISSNFE